MSTPEEMRAAIEAFRALEWERSDWQGHCPFRRHADVRCKGTDGTRGGFGTPKPHPHSERCPYRLLAGLDLEPMP